MGIAVRDVAMTDLEQVAGVWERAWRSSGRRKSSVPLALSLDRLRRRVEDAAGGGFRLLAAWDGETVAGIATVSLTDGGPLMDAPGVHIHVLHVDDGHRDRGVGTALLREVTDWAASMGSDQIVVDIPPASRQVARWYAGWGFGPYLHRRVATTAGIRRRLGGQSPLRVVPGNGHRAGATAGLRRARGR